MQLSTCLLICCFCVLVHRSCCRVIFVPGSANDSQNVRLGLIKGINFFDSKQDLEEAVKTGSSWPAYYKINLEEYNQNFNSSNKPKFSGNGNQIAVTTGVLFFKRDGSFLNGVTKLDLSEAEAEAHEALSRLRIGDIQHPHLHTRLRPESNWLSGLEQDTDDDDDNSFKSGCSDE